MAKPSVTLKIDENTAKKMSEFYESDKKENSGTYVFFHAVTIDDVTVTIYSSSKGFKAVFIGEKALEESHIWDVTAEVNISKDSVKTEWKDTHSQIGSDEVGTGDFFGPVIVVACYCSSETITLLNEFKINDSKKLSDKKILQIVPQILDKVTYSKLTCSPSKFNEMIEKGHNLNEIKAILHNEALHNVRGKIHNSNTICYVDQFCEPAVYYSYLQGKYDAIFNNIVFETKAESHYPSVAIASMIARYAFLKYFEELKIKYGVEFPKGANKKVDEFALFLKNKIGIDELSTLVKKKFKNYQNLL